MRAQLAITFLLVAATLGSAHRVAAHGIVGHMHVTGWAIDNLPPGELKAIFEDPDVFRAAVTGAMFPDTGYPLDKPAAREYAEYTHWEPFIDRFVEHIRTTYAPPYDTKEEKMLIAFLMGCAAHGLQDELFDSTFLYETEQRDGHSAEVADPGTDGFLVLDGYFRLVPSDYLPIDEILPLYAVLNQPIDRALIESQVSVVRNAYANDTLGPLVAANYGRRALPQIPWAAQHYLDMGIAGSLGAEVEPTLHYLEALWERLNGRFDDSHLIVHTWPEAPRRLRSANHNDVASWVTLVFGKGVQQDSATPSLVDMADTTHPFQLRYTRWGGTSRLVRFQPTEDFQPGAFYTASIAAGATLVDGTQTTHAQELTFQVDCLDPDDAACPPVTIADDPALAEGTPKATPTPTKASTPTPTPCFACTPKPSPTWHFGCGGDCDNSGDVTVDEVVTAVNIALGAGSLGGCANADVDGDGMITVDEIILLVNTALVGCP